ncbi:Tc toxin subunit A [Pseudomonas moraviensis]|uniref:Tc toxin subunit A n=1 Tax=Pseudomonas moraviensis TaxID=321662 RepID=UPI001059977D|nr:Tc toxin subunit A [Pseudomonas moraviensis]TDK52596.1 virulence plasmid 28 protein [Pseudomonas moraviensis]
MASKNTAKKPGLELFEQVFGEQQNLEKFAGLRSWLERGKSIFPLVEKGAEGLAKDFNISVEEAQMLVPRLNGLAVYLRRQFIEQSLTGEPKPAPYAAGGFNTGPSYELLFRPAFDQFAPVGALEDATGVVAYLVEMWKWAGDNIEKHGDPNEVTGMIPIHTRRGDIRELVIDHNAMQQTVSAVDITLGVLEKLIGLTEPELEDAMILRRYPNGLPYYKHWATINAVVAHHGLSVGHFARWTDIEYPNFLLASAWDEGAGRALAHASRLGPFQRELLTEDLIPDDADSDTREAFYLKNYGTTGVDWQNLNQVDFFAQRTKLDAEGVEAFLSIRRYAPTRSHNVRIYALADAAESERSGSVFINGGESPAISVNYENLLHRLSESPLNPGRYDRMNRKRRLDLWLRLPPEEVDSLLVAAFNAEWAGIPDGPENPAIWMTDHTVHALGLFQTLREGFDCKAADFAVFIDKFSIYGRGQVASQFDQIFNNVQGDYRDPLLLDDGVFPLLPAQGVPELTVSRICSALEIDLQTYQYLALAIAHDRTDTLVRSPEILSAFYRLVKLPRLLGMTPVEGLLMLMVLGGEAWADGLAGVPLIKGKPTDGDTVPDVLDLISALVACRYWCRTRNLPVLWMLQQVADPQVSNVATEPELRLFEQVRNLLGEALLTHTGFVTAGVPPLVGRDWKDLLSSLTDPLGLVKSREGTEDQYVVFARGELDKAVREGLNEDDISVRAPIVEIMLTVLLQARAAQLSVARECLAVYTGQDAERALKTLNWANSSVYELLVRIVEQMGEEWALSRTLREEPLDPLFFLLADIRRLSAVVAELDISLETLDALLDYGLNDWWEHNDPEVFTVATLYYLTVLTHAFEISKQPHTELLEYLRQIHEWGDPKDLSTDALRLAQRASEVWLARFFDWSEQEVNECIGRIDPQYKLLKNLQQLDLLVRVRELATHTNMDAVTIFLLGTLPETVDKPIYKDAAEHASLSLWETAPAVRPSAELRAPLINMQIVPDNSEVIAGSGGKIIFTITLTDQDGKALSGVSIRGQASLGTLVIGKTQPETGIATATYTPGKVMGAERPLFWVPLITPQEGPLIQLTDDGLNLDFPAPFMSRVPTGVVPAGQAVELSAVLMDRFGNLGKNRLVRWSATAIGDEPLLAVEAVIRPLQGQTTQQGIARAVISSPTGGTFVCTVLSETSENAVDFAPIAFAPLPTSE